MELSIIICIFVLLIKITLTNTQQSWAEKINALGRRCFKEENPFVTKINYMKVNNIDEYSIKTKIKICPIEVQQYIDALKGSLDRQKEITKKAINKLKENKQVKKIRINHYHYQCGDGCCDYFGADIYINDEKIERESDGEYADSILSDIVKHLGLDIEIEETYNDEK